MKYLKYIFIVLLILVGFYLIGPKAKYDAIDYATPELDIPLTSLDSIIAAWEAKVSDLKPDNEARIVWADSTHTKTKFVLLYLHGFSASQEEGDPIHIDFAKKYGMNLYLPRLEDHGRYDENTFKNLTPDNYFESAQHALKIAELLGDSIILMSCSTGSTLAILLEGTSPKIHSHIMYSPNIDIADPSSKLVVKPWGKDILKLVMGGEYNRIEYTPEGQKYWNTDYHVNGIIVTKYLLENYMTEENFKKVKTPLFLGYYYKNDKEQDNVVSVPRMKEFFNAVSTPTNQKELVAFPKAGRHVIASHVMSGDLDGVKTATYKFWDRVVMKGF